MKYFGLENIDAAEEEFIPPSVLNGSKPSKRLWLHKHVQNILETYVMKKQSSEHAGIRAGVASESRPPQRVVTCQVCGREYRYKKALNNHVLKQHPDHTEGNLAKEASPQANPEPIELEITDDRFNYACVRLSMGLLLRNVDDAVKEGDGDRIIRCWKISLLLFRAHHHTKYALASLHLQAALLHVKPLPCLEQNC